MRGREVQAIGQRRLKPIYYGLEIIGYDLAWEAKHRAGESGDKSEENLRAG